MTVEQAMEFVGTDLYFEVVENGVVIEDGRYDIVSRTLDFPVERIEMVNVNDPDSMICRIHV